MHTYAPGPVLVSGRGARVTDETGREYLDFTAGIAVCVLGHAHPAVLETLSAQAAKLTHCSNLFVNEHAPRLAARLAAVGGLGGRSFFANSGAEANECLIKLARKWGNARGKNRIVAFEHSFHGRTLATLAATWKAKYRDGFGPDMPGFAFAKYNDLDDVARVAGNDTAAVLVEAIQGEGGVTPATDGFLRGLRRLCDERNMLLLCDEVQCGMGRTGDWFAFRHADIAPDAFSVAKGLGNGFPVGAAVAGEKLSDIFTPGAHGTTFGGNPLACAVARTVIDVIERENLLDNAKARGEELLAGFRALREAGAPIADVRGRGLMIGVETAGPAAPHVEAMRKAGLLAILTGENVIRLVPPLNIGAGEVAEALAAAKTAFAR
ncbi:MAG: aspartate aminotransferase family protein [Kiritimatiellae bacterium]|nr:aspartate aminotransferase family protein [Kiritimatiellia bacterium]